MDALTRHRRPRWEHVLLSARDEPIARLDGVTGGGCELVALSRFGSSGSLSLDERGQSIDWLNHRVQSIYDPGIRGVEPWPVSTLRLTSPNERHTSMGVSYTVELLSKMSIIDSASVGIGYALPAGTHVVDTVVGLIEATGETRIAVTPSDAALPAMKVFEPDATYLTVINELLEAIGYWSLWCDGAGQFRVEPYVAPGDRPVAWHFMQGAASVHMPDWDRDQDLANIPNVFKVWREGDEDTPGIEGVAVNEDPLSPFSVGRRGFEITASESAEVETVADAVALAQRRLLDRMSPVGKIAAKHAVLPLDPNQVIRFTDSGYDGLATIQRMSFDFTPDSDCAAEWREL